MKVLVRMELDFGKMGKIESLFVCDDSDLTKLENSYVEVGEFLGIRADVSCEITPDDYKVVSNNQEYILWFENNVGTIGLNPLKN